MIKCLKLTLGRLSVIPKIKEQENLKLIYLLIQNYMNEKSR